jgi:hypothetical protein
MNRVLFSGSERVLFSGSERNRGAGKTRPELREGMDVIRRW